MEREPNIFVFQIRAAAGVPARELEQALLARAATFALAAHPTLDPTLLSHRILRGAGGEHAWEIAFEGIEPIASGDEPMESLGDLLFAEVRATVAGLGEIGSFVAYTDLTIPAPGRGFERGRVGEESVPFAPDDLPGWEDYASDAGTEDAGAEIDADVLDEIARSRAAVPVEPGLKRWGSGHMYGGGDALHRTYLNSYLEARAARASAADRRRILAFRAFQSREGSTAAINTYDNQIVTWGTGWGGLGGLGKVMERVVANETVRETLGRSGLRYRGKNVYDVVDLDTQRVVTAQKEALQIVKRSLPLLYLLIFIARDPSTRDAATEAQLQTFMLGSANIPGADAIATQALFNLVVHLKHWAPGYVIGCMEWATPQAGDGPPSEVRDRRLATLIGRYFYGKARKTSWIPDWKQFQLYFRHMKEDGLDCLSDPFIQASAPPTEDPFAAPPPVLVTSTLKNPPLAGEPELEALIAGKSALRKGARGAGVKALQEAMMAIAIDVPGGADGVFGPNLERAVMAFQEKQHLTVDGVVGRKTLEALDACLGAAP
ncbi:Hypothetical protein A7982_11717 [Minicystis rosea]|nr:Hypothetical protein A7982_11717 [Minicystis rosea]